ncbi:MAG: T9SS type A sorting domain-containing protein [Putridiphycobacter sp.]|nr:T9SS type A sorting domain-containing protein [Putridiphycobacter sp.]
MKLLGLLYLLFVSALYSIAQPIINERYTIGSASIFANVIASDSCYYVTGMRALQQGFSLQEGVFIKFNLDGSIADTTYYKNDSANYVFWESSNLIRTLDVNFAQTFATDTIGSHKYFGFIKLKPNGDTLIFRTYLDLYQQNNDDRVVQPGGFLQDPIDSAFYGTVNVYRYSDLVGGTALFKISKTGELLWHQTYYGVLGNFRIFNAASLIKIAPDRLMIGGTQTHTPVANADWRDNTKILIVDTLGNIIQTKIYPADQLANGCNGLTQTMDGGYIYGGQNGTFVQNGNARRYQARIVKLNANLIEEWRIEEDQSKSQTSVNFENILKVNDTSFVAIGKTIDSLTYNFYNTAGRMLKFNLNGDVLWRRYYQKVLPDQNTNNFPTHILYDVAITPDSGFVMVGQSQNFEASNPEPLGQLGWLVKADKHGCLVPGCEQFDGLSISQTDLPEIGLKVYPNPASNELFVYYSNAAHTNNVSASLYNSNGQEILIFDMSTNNTTYMLNVAALSKGIYFLKVTSDVSERVKKIIVE